MITFNDQHVLVTGGSSGIGLALCQQFYESGAIVWMIGRDVERLRAGQRQIIEKNAGTRERLHILSLDVTAPQAVNQAFSKILDEHGHIDLLINNAGAAHPGYVEELEPAIYRWMMEVNYFGTVNCVKEVLPAMIERRKGHIVNVASLAGVIGIFGYSAYAPAKFAVRGFSEVLRVEMKPYGIIVSIVYPPDTDTPQLEYENQYKPVETRALAKQGGLLGAEAVARDIIAGIARKKFTILPGSQSKWIYLASGLFRPLINPIQDFIVSKNRAKEPS